ncbi:hypothetical protein PAXINDRAFT_85239, partial [Paxillus involutus ATCC 200175]
HSALCNVIKQIFGVLKHQWCILQLAPEYSMAIQACIPATLCTIHNFIHNDDPNIYERDFLGDLVKIDHDVGWGTLAEGLSDAAERRRADTQCDCIAEDMWADYLDKHRRRSLPLPGNTTN